MTRVEAARLGGGNPPVPQEALDLAHTKAIALLRDYRATQVRKMRRPTGRWFLAAGLVVGFAAGWATRAHGTEVHAIVHGLSYHLADRTSTGAAYNGRNWGLGVRAQFTPSMSVQMSRALNSYHRWSWYAIGEWGPVEIFGARIGAFVGATENYPMNNGGVIPAGGSFARWAHGTYSVTTRFAPPVAKHSGVVTIEVGWRFL